MSLYRTIVVPHDFSPHSGAALDHAVRLARDEGARLHVVHVVHTPAWIYAGAPSVGTVAFPPELIEDVRRRTEASLRELMGELRVPAEIYVLEGSPTEAICELAEKVDADLIVMGTHGRTGLAHAFLGSVTERTLRHAPCPVLTLRRDGDD